ncbi:dual specificity protein kinase shkE-like [Patiria miniata]|uniref:Protein kinase domain-containing protein n=1 Tax=Patiria miniata TaxID=46514 RepID=A0A913Z648_PATMI|nr:dual specificity protein kinase shkE-like [Patiria miniata]
MPRGSTYADNSYNRSLGRVGAAMGSMPASSSSRSSSGGGGYSASGSHCYVDNSFNRSVGRVGMQLGSMPVSRLSSSSSESSGYSSTGSPGTYVDNAFNRSVGRVGMPLGSMSVSKSPSSRASSASSTSSVSTYVAGEVKVYKDNAFNRRLGRVGEQLGSMPNSRDSTASVSAEKVYVDNSVNRQLGRVGLKLGSMPVSRTGSTNSRKQTQPTHAMKKMYDQLLKPEVDDVGDLPTDIPHTERDYMCNTVFSLIRRMNQALKWKESNQGKQPRTALKTFKYDGPVVTFEEIDILEKIGHGGFGDVHFGKYKGTVVAVKKLRVQRVSQRRLRQFQEEVEILCRLDHPHIVRFIGASIVTPNLAILLEYMQKSLYEALHVEEQVHTPKEQRQILQHMADGLAYLHGKWVAHCDMKSTNILLDSTDDGIVAKISDFGLSLMKIETETSQSTAKVQGVGTPKYSAPEVLAGEELGLPAMCKADVYSMSVVAWEVICQEVPFSGLNIHQLMRRVCSGDVNLKFPEDVQVGDGLKDLLKRCWSRDANKRPSAQAFKDRLARLESIL